MSEAVERMVAQAADSIRVSEGEPPLGSRLAARIVLQSLGLPLSVLAALKEGTWKAVPVESIETMELAGEPFCRPAQDNPLCGFISPRRKARESYKAMLKAAPATPEDKP